MSTGQRIVLALPGTDVPFDAFATVSSSYVSFLGGASSLLIAGRWMASDFREEITRAVSQVNMVPDISKPVKLSEGPFSPVALRTNEDSDGNLSWLVNLSAASLFSGDGGPPPKVNPANPLRCFDDYDAINAKPGLTYTELIEKALLEKGELTVSEIYKWIYSKYPYYKKNDGRWKNSIRHNLSINPQFRKGEKCNNGGHFWTLNKEYDDEFKKWFVWLLVQWLHSREYQSLASNYVTSQGPRTLSHQTPDDVAVNEEVFMKSIFAFNSMLFNHFAKCFYIEITMTAVIKNIPGGIYNSLKYYALEEVRKGLKEEKRKKKKEEDELEIATRSIMLDDETSECSSYPQKEDPALIRVANNILNGIEEKVTVEFMDRSEDKWPHIPSEAERVVNLIQKSDLLIELEKQVEDGFNTTNVTSHAAPMVIEEDIFENSDPILSDPVLFSDCLELGFQPYELIDSRL